MLIRHYIYRKIFIFRFTNNAHIDASLLQCQLSTFVEPKGCEVVAHVPPTYFVSAIPFEFIVCFKADKKGTVGLLHNLPLEDSVYQARITASSIFKRMAPSVACLAAMRLNMRNNGPAMDQKDNWPVPLRYPRRGKGRTCKRAENFGSQIPRNPRWR